MWKKDQGFGVGGGVGTELWKENIYSLAKGRKKEWRPASFFLQGPLSGERSRNIRKYLNNRIKSQGCSECEPCSLMAAGLGGH